MAGTEIEVLTFCLWNQSPCMSQTFGTDHRLSSGLWGGVREAILGHYPVIPIGLFLKLPSLKFD